MTKRRKSTPEDDQRVRDSNAPWEERAAALLNVAVDHLEYLEPDVVRLLEHEMGDLRGQALSTLLFHWKRETYLPKAFKMLMEDPCEYARCGAAFALAGYLATTGLHRDRILRALARAVCADPESSVVYKAYVGLVRNIDPDRKTGEIPLDIVRDRDVDWKLIQPYVPN